MRRVTRLATGVTHLTRWVCIPITPLLRPVKLPGLRRRVPLWVLLIVSAAIVLPLTGTAIVVTNQPIFCKSCHEMSLHYATWSQSAHQTVSCEDCHVMPGMANMLKSKLHALRLVREHAAGDVRATAIQGHVPDANCKRCHSTTDDLVAYHGLKITHKAHWGMGVKCTFCHDRVAHGPKWLYTGVTSSEKVAAVTTPYKYTPQMEVCYKCHDGKTAPNECSTCHVTLGERKPTVFDPAWVEAHRQEVHQRGEQDCERCHLPNFCDACHRAANPHPADWVARHPQEARKDSTGCFSCHLAPAEARPKDVKNMAFCRACHGLRQEHRQADWQVIHGRESLANPAACQRCHTASWCSDCHAISRPHPQEWRARHPAEANRNPESCRVCHTQQFCDACHHGKQGVPASHATDWLTRHKDAAKLGEASCRTCHKPSFCQSCHAKKAPASHGPQWIGQHGAASKAQPASCLLCHTEKHCDSCHGLAMPHPKAWLASHPKTALKDRALCDRCHGKEACESCHRGAFPTSHAPADWLSRHGGEAKKPHAECSLCHRQEFCSSCHGLAMPHPKGWEREPHGVAAQKDRTVCARCHRESECSKCHGLDMPHPATWVTQHGAKAIAAPSVCATCHGAGRHDCAACHSTLPPSSHQQGDWSKQHGQAGAAAMGLCALCHGKNACSDCHARGGVAVSKQR